MRILSVLDLMGGQVVRGVAGHRHLYAPIESRLTASTQPLDVAQAFRDHFGFNELYLADLDAIAGKLPATAVYAELLRQGFRLWVDAGTAWETLADVGVQNILAGLESLPDLRQLRELVDRYSSMNIVFSLDLRDGQPLQREAWSVDRGAWTVDRRGPAPPTTVHGPRTTLHASHLIAQQAVNLGIRRILVLDLAAVGMNRGTPTEELCSRLRSSLPSLEITTGGGIRGINDLHRLRQIGVDNVLIASALHDGRLTRNDVLEFQSGESVSRDAIAERGFRAPLSRRG